MAAQDGGWRVLLDGKPILSVGRRPQVVPSRALAELMAGEWAEQGETIDPARFVMRDMADYAIDVVAPDRVQAISELMPYGETDTLCYRAETGHPVRREQDRVWEPLLAACETRHGLAFVRIGGIVHQPQPPATLAKLTAMLAEQDDFALAALRNLAGLAASLVIGLTALSDEASAEALWDAANLEEDWQAEQWGRDAEAQALRARRLAAFLAAARFAALARDKGA